VLRTIRLGDARHSNVSGWDCERANPLHSASLAANRRSVIGGPTERWTPMSEIADLVSICVAVDRSIADDPAGRSRVAGVLPVDAAELDEVFRHGRAGGFDGMAGRSSVDEALRRLADIPARGALATSRSLAIAALAQAQPDYAAGGAKADLASRALRVDAPATGPSDGCTRWPTARAFAGRPSASTTSPRFRRSVGLLARRFRAAVDRLGRVVMMVPARAQWLARLDCGLRKTGDRAHRG
jgi:hypothetical protein